MTGQRADRWRPERATSPLKRRRGPRVIADPTPPVELAGGPLAGCTVHVPSPALDAGVCLVPGHRGRYVRIDGLSWSWETDHRDQ